MSAPSIVQATKGDNATAATIAFPSNVTAGNLLLVYATEATANGSGLAVSDSLHNTWTPLGFVTTGAGVGNCSGAWFWAKANASGANSVTISATFNSPCGGAIIEISGADGVTPINQNASAADLAGSNAPASGPITTTVANCLLIGGCIQENNFETFGAGTGWTLQSSLTQPSPSNIAYAIETQNATSAGTYNAQFTMSISNAWCAHIIAIAPISASGGSGGGLRGRSLFRRLATSGRLRGRDLP